MTRQRSRNNRGVTLVELLIVMVMMGLVATAMFSLYKDTSRSSTGEDDVVELQQMLRTTLDQIADDIRMAGFMVSGDFAPIIVARTMNPATGGGVEPYPAPPTKLPRTVHFMMRTGSAHQQVIRIAENSPATGVSSPTREFSGIGSEQLMQLASDNYVRVYRASTADQPLVTRYSVSITPETGTPEKITLTSTIAADLKNVEFRRGDLIARVLNNGVTSPAPTPDVLPEYVMYETEYVKKQDAPTLEAMPALPNNPAGGPLDAAVNITRYVGSCRTAACFPIGAANTLTGNSAQVGTVIGKIDTTQPAAKQVGETNVPRITRLTFSYIRRDGSEVAAVADGLFGTTANSLLRNIVAVRVTIAGQTPSGKRRELSTVVRLMNRDYDAVKE